MYWNDTWKLMSVFVLPLAWSPVNKTYMLCLISHDKRNLQHKVISHLIASEIIKIGTFFYWYYTLWIIQLQIIKSLRSILNILNKLSKVGKRFLLATEYNLKLNLLTLASIRILNLNNQSASTIINT